MVATHIRQAAVHEADALSALAFRAKAHWGYAPAFMEACRAELTYTGEDLKTHPFYVMVSEGQILGFYALRQRSAATVALEALFVDPAWMGQGVGRRLIEHAKAQARRWGATVMLIESDPNAATFYVKAGGKQIGEQASGSIAGRVLPVFEITLM